MRRFYPWLTFFIGSFFITVGAETRASFYVSPTGSDKSPGTLGAPFKTVARARDAVSQINSAMSGDIYVYLRGGTYYLDTTLVFKEKDSGTNGFRVIYKAYQGEKPVISGGRKLTGGWTRHSGDIYKTGFDYDKKLRSLYVNGRYRKMAGGKFIQGRGGSGAFKITGSEPWAITSGSCAAGIKFKPSEFGDYSNPGDIELISDISDPYLWTQQRICVDTITTSGDFRIARVQQPGFALSQSLAWKCDMGPNDIWKAVNALELLDSAGEFYFNKAEKTLYYHTAGNEDINTAVVIAPVLEKVMDISGKSTSNRVSHISFDGLTFSHNNYLLMNGGSFGSTTVQSIAMYYRYRNDGDWHKSQYNNTRPMDAAIELKNTEKIDFLNNKFINLTGVGLSLLNDAIESQIIGNIFKDISASSLNIGHPQHYKIGDGAIFGDGVEGACNNNTIRNNLITNPSYEHIQAAGVSAFFVAGTDLSHNDISGTPYSSVSFGWWWGNAGIPASKVMKDNKIDSNKVYDGTKTLHDGGLVYILGYSPNSKARGNYLLRSHIGNGFHPDDGASYWTFDHNVVENVGKEWMGLWNKHSLDCVVSNNFCNTTIAKLKGTNSKFINNTTQLDAPPWSSPVAHDIIAHAGLEPRFQSLFGDTATLGTIPIIRTVKKEFRLMVNGFPYPAQSWRSTNIPSDNKVEVYNIQGKSIWRGSAETMENNWGGSYSPGVSIIEVKERKD